MQQRHLILGLVLLMTVVAAVYPEKDNTFEVIEAISSHQDKTTGNLITPNEHALNHATPLPANHSRYWEHEKNIIDLFYNKPKVTIVTSPAAVSLAPTINLSPPEPVAPPLPFSYLGKMVEENKTTVYVSKAGRNYVLRGGEVIDGIYTVKSVDVQQVVFEYTPLKIDQVLIIRGAN